MLDNVEGIEQQLRQSIEDESSYKHPEPFRYPKPRTTDEYKKPTRDVSESRKWELYNVPWEENEWSSHRPGKIGVVKGAFDAGSLGGGKNLLKVRRTGLDPEHAEQMEQDKERRPQFEEQKEEIEPQKATKKLEQAPMKFYPTNQKPARPNIVDKYFTQIRDGDAHHHSLRFDKRRPDHWLQRMEDGNMLPQGTATKYGKGHDTKVVEVLPSSYQHTELFTEAPRTSEHPFQLAKDCSRPVAPFGPGVLSTDKHKIYHNSKRNPLGLEETAGRTFQRPLERFTAHKSGSLSAR